MKLIFLGTPELAVPTLEKLHKEFTIIAVVTPPDKATGRSKKIIPCPIAEAAHNWGLPLFQPNKLDEVFIEELKALNADYFLTFAYGKIFPKDFLTITHKGGLNIHPSLLPAYRGASPLQQAILDGKKESGISLQKVALEVDSGDIIASVPFEILEKDDIISIEEKVSMLASDLATTSLKAITRLESCAIPQDETLASYCKKFVKQDGIIDWKQSAFAIFCQIRAFRKWPVATTTLDGKKLFIHEADYLDNGITNKNPGKVIAAGTQGLQIACGTGILSITTLQIQGKREMNVKDFLNGYRNMHEKVLGEELS